MNVVDEFLEDDRLPPTVYALITIFILFSLLAALGPEKLPEPVREQIEGAVSNVKDIAGLPAYLLPLAIFANNLLVSVMVSLLSFTIIVPLASLAFNGIVVGYVIISAASQAPEAGELLTPAAMASLLAPHGSLEIPAVAVAASSMVWITRGLKTVLKASLRNLIVAVSMLIVAAIAEVLVTPLAFILSQAIPHP